MWSLVSFSVSCHSVCDVALARRLGVVGDSWPVPVPLFDGVTLKKIHAVACHMVKRCLHAVAYTELNIPDCKPFPAELFCVAAWIGETNCIEFCPDEGETNLGRRLAEHLKRRPFMLSIVHSFPDNPRLTESVVRFLPSAFVMMLTLARRLPKEIAAAISLLAHEFVREEGMWIVPLHRPENS